MTGERTTACNAVDIYNARIDDDDDGDDDDDDDDSDSDGTAEN